MPPIKSGQDKQLAQSLPTGSSATSIFSPTVLDLSGPEQDRGTSPREIIITHAICCNVSGAKAEYSMYFDDDGTTYGDSTAILKDVDIKKGESHFIEMRLIMNQDAGNLAAFSRPNASVNFTITGELKA